MDCEYWYRYVLLDEPYAFLCTAIGDLHAIAWIHAQICEETGRPRRFNRLSCGGMNVHGGL